MALSREENLLVQRMKRGERRAYEEFIDSYGARILRLVRRYVENSSDAEDLVQEIFFEVYRSIGAFRGEAALSTYVYRIATHHCFRHCKRNKQSYEALPEIDEPDGDWRNAPEASAVKQELADHVHDALAALPLMQRDIVILHELHGLTYQECAAVLEVPVGTVKSRLSGAFKRLRVRLGGYVLGEGAESMSSRQKREQEKSEVTEEVRL
jgi:RNA polymerase sigma-70 factor (ECF subfamily)